MPRSHGRGKTDEAEGASPAAGMWRSDLGIAPYARLRPDCILFLRRASPRCLRQRRGCSDCRQREVIERQDRWFRGLAEFFASQGEKSVKSVFCGGVYLAKHTSQPASVRASPASECAQQAATPSVGKARWLCRQIEHPRAACGSGWDAFFALREAGFSSGLPFVIPCRIFGKFIRQMGDWP